MCTEVLGLEVPASHLGGLLRPRWPGPIQSFSFRGSGVGSRARFLSKFPGEADAAGPGTTLGGLPRPPHPSRHVDLGLCISRLAEPTASLMTPICYCLFDEAHRY